VRWTAAALVLVAAAPAYAQAPTRDNAPGPPQTGTATIRARVLAAATGDRLRHAVVTITGGQSPIAPVLTDEDGRFEFDHVPAGVFTITASKPGFARASESATVAAGAIVSAGDLKLAKGAALSGVMLDARGYPVAFAGVVVLRVIPKEDGSVGMAAVATTTTDDAGAFRFGSLPADTYVVNPTRMGNGVFLAAQPGVEIRQAGRLRMPDTPRIVLQAGEERAGVTLTGANDRPPFPPLPDAAQIDLRKAIVVRGRVTIRGGAPAGAAVVQLLSVVPGPPAITQTDESGMYELIVPSRPEGDYRVLIRKETYAPAEYGAPAPNRRGELLHLAPGDVREHLDVALNRLSTISGRILDDTGDAVEGALVRVAQLRYTEGQRKLVEPPVVSLRTDDLGRYRIFGLRPGQYAIVASVGQIVVTESAAEFPGYGTTYFPGTTNPAEIQLLSIGVAQELTDVDFRLVRQKTFRVAGHASDSTGDPITGGISLTQRRRSGSVAAVQLGARIDRGGGFEFLNVAPGEYVLQVVHGMGRNASTEGEFAYRFIDVVDSDVTDVEMQTGLGSTISGHVTFDGGEPPSTDRLEVSVVPVDLDRTPNGQTARARVDPEQHTFELARVNGPRRIQVTQAPPGWAMTAVIVNGIDVTDQPLAFGREDESLVDVEVRLSSRATRLTGRITDARGSALTDLAVLAFSHERDHWYLNTRFIRRTAPKSDGTFSFEGLPPGDYYVWAAYPPDDQGEWRDPDVLEKLTLEATRARLLEGQQVSLDLKVR
jgi:Carboxypeptidase regulatory-like domain